MVSATDESLLPWFTLNVDDDIVLVGKFGLISETVNRNGYWLDNICFRHAHEAVLEFYWRESLRG